MPKVTLTRDFQYEAPGDVRKFAAGERELAEPYLTAARAAAVIADAPEPKIPLRRRPKAAAKPGA